MTSWFEKLKHGLQRTSAPVVQGIESLFFQKKPEKEFLQDLEDLLIMADVGAKTAAELVDGFKNEKVSKDASPEDIRRFFAGRLTDILTPCEKPLIIDESKKPFVILMVGVNGAGKTTTIGKLASQMRQKGLKVRFAAADTFRAAAVEQLKVWAERADCPIVAKPAGADAAGLVFDALEESIAAKDDVLFIDTAGRLQNKSELMAELQKIERIIKKKIPDAPHACLQVIDATVGQNAKSQVKIFSELTHVTGLILTKLDGTAKGGVTVALAQEFKLPVHYVGTGEKIDDLTAFNATRYAYSLMGLEEK